MEPIGAGGYGIVYLLPDGNVVKAIYSRTACDEAHVEYKKQKRVYDCLEKLHRCEDPFVAQFIPYIHVAKPLSYSDEPLVFDSSKYACSFTMSRLNALPLAFYNAYDATYFKQRFEPHYLTTLEPQHYGIMTHLAFNSEVPGLYGATYSKTRISKQNPPRGYFVNKESGFLAFLRREYNLKWSDQFLERMMGFIYGWIYFTCDIIPIDIEFTLGYNQTTKEFELNVLDFGMTLDKRHLTENPVVPRTDPFLAIYDNSQLSSEEKEAAILSQTLNDIDIDLYASMQEPSESYSTFQRAGVLGACTLCNIPTFLVSHEHYICSEKCLALYFY
jgi:hypothetical protein